MEENGDKKLMKSSYEIRCAYCWVSIHTNGCFEQLYLHLSLSLFVSDHFNV